MQQRRQQKMTVPYTSTTHNSLYSNVLQYVSSKLRTKVEFWKCNACIDSNFSLVDLRKLTGLFLLYSDRIQNCNELLTITHTDEIELNWIYTRIRTKFNKNRGPRSSREWKIKMGMKVEAQEEMHTLFWTMKLHTKFMK